MENYFAGISLSLNGAAIASNGFVNFGDIGGVPGTDASALLCHADGLMNCCRTSQIGHWHFPDGMTVESFSEQKYAMDVFARNRGDTGVVRLYHHGNPSERGSFYCNISAQADDNQIVYVNICKLFIVVNDGACACNH